MDLLLCDRLEPTTHLRLSVFASSVNTRECMNLETDILRLALSHVVILLAMVIVHISSCGNKAVCYSEAER